MLKRLKPYMMPISITVGALFYKFFMALSFLTPYLIFGMLFFTYCALNLKQMRLSRLHIWLLLIQIPGSLIVFFILSPINITLAQGVMICVLAPTGTAAPVITGMLKGNVGSWQLPSYSHWWAVIKTCRSLSRLWLFLSGFLSCCFFLLRWLWFCKKSFPGQPL